MTAEPRRAVAALVRVSTQTQDVESQRACLQEWAEERDVDLAWYDEGEVSGAKGAEFRPGLARLLADAEAGAVKELVITEVSRIGRAPPETMERFLTLRRLKVAVYVVDRDPDAPVVMESAIDFIYFCLEVFSAGHEREKGIMRSARGQALARSKGVKFGGPGLQMTEADVADVRARIGRGEAVRAIAPTVCGWRVEGRCAKRDEPGVRVEVPVGSVDEWALRRLLARG